MRRSSTTPSDILPTLSATLSARGEEGESEGHQHHFLSRLDRVSAAHVELALSLYRDVELLRYILGNVRLPEGASRVAISLDDPSRGPFLVVTRGGIFVTCLGAGMSPGDLPVVTRGQLDGIAAKASDLRERMEACTKLAGERGGMNKVLSRIYEAADELSREEFIAISALQPIFAVELCGYFFRTIAEINKIRVSLVDALRKSDRLKPYFNESLRSYWRLLWGIGHLSVLTAMGGIHALDAVSQHFTSKESPTSYSWGVVRQGVLGLTLKGAWGVARLGKAMLPGFKARFANAQSHFRIMDSVMGLAVLGVRHARLRAEVQKALEGGVDFTNPAVERLLGPMAKIAAETALHAMENPEPFALIQRDLGAQIAVELGQTMPKNSPYRFERVEDVPPDLAMTLAVNDQAPLLRGPTLSPAGAMMFYYLPWLARAEPESLYLPQDYMKAIHAPFRPEMSLRILRAHRDYMAPRRRQAKPEGPARKGPCPCGSGKKYKRCCGDEDGGGSDTND